MIMKKFIVVLSALFTVSFSSSFSNAQIIPPENAPRGSTLSQLYNVSETYAAQPIENLLENIEIPAVSAPANEPVEKKYNGAVILTIPGIKPSSIWSYIFGKISKEGVPLQDNPNGSLSENDQWLKDYFEIPTDFDYQEFKSQVLEMAEEQTRASKDDYLEEPILAIPGYAHLNIYMETYFWSRNAIDSAKVLPGLMDKIKSLSAKAAQEGKPFYIFSHSWGTILSHTALHRLSRSDNKVKVDTWITSGSPLVPSNKIVRNFSNYMINKGGLEKQVSQPSNVSSWVNVWGKHDIISNEIRQCPVNYEMDKPAREYENNISFWSFYGIPDWIRMKNPLPWHSAYHEDFHTYLKSLKVPVDILVFEPYIQPSLMK